MSNVRDFGAIGDGQTDDTQAIRRGIQHAAGASRTNDWQWCS